MDLKNREVQRFRTNIDPMVGPKPKNAFDRRELTNWVFELTPVGVYVRMPVRDANTQQTSFEEHVIPYANIQSIKLTPLEPKKE